MLESLRMIFERLIDNVNQDYHRYLYSQFSIGNRLTGLVGPRGVGKTTLMLQYIKENHPKNKDLFYFSADHIYFKSISLYEFIEDLYLNESIKIFFIDEIHKYENWNQELKNLYDGFPDIKLVFSGSSSLDLINGAYDLSRRAKMYSLSGMSFREYLEFTNNISLEKLDFNSILDCVIGDVENILKVPKLLNQYHAYLQQGFYPFFYEDPLSYYEKILRIIEKTIYEDIANFYNLKTLNLKHFSKILNYLASVPPGKISTYNLGKNLSIDDKTAGSYLNILHETGLVEIFYPAESGSQGLRKPEKVFFNNTNLHYAIGQNQSDNIEIGTIRELAFVQSVTNAGINIHHSKVGDFVVGDTIFEVGGKNKTRHQVKGSDSAFLVKDDILSLSRGTIPLVLFGFLY